MKPCRTLLLLVALGLAFAPAASGAPSEPTASLIKDIQTSGTSDWSGPEDFTEVGSQVFFSATDIVTSTELWITDGTDAGTRRVKDIRVGSSGSRPEELTASGGLVFFRARDHSDQETLWRSDGTEA